jgi:NitT/TauT family transport system permease protein
MREAMRRVGPPVLAMIVLGAVWWAIAQTGFWDRTLLPSPGSVWRSLQLHMSDGTIPAAVGKTLVRLAFGLGVAIVLGTLLGVAMAASSFVQRSLGSLVFGLHSIPAIAWLPLAILWLSLTERAILLIVVLGALPSVAIGTAASIRQVPPLLVRAGRTMGAKGFRLYSKVVIPAALPGYVAGLQQAWVFAWWSLLAGELIATGSRGLGHFTDAARQQFDTPAVIASLVVIALIGMVVDLAVFQALDHRIRARRGLSPPG